MDHLFHFPLVSKTVESIKACVADIDAQLDELAEKQQMLQGARRALAALAGIDRRDDAGKIAKMADAAKRAEYEGEGQQDDRSGRLKARAGS